MSVTLIKITLRACSLSSTLGSSETPEKFSSTAFHSPCNTIDDFILIFHKLKLVIPSNFGTSYFADDVDTLLDAISPQINAQKIAQTAAEKKFLPATNSRPIERTTATKKRIHGNLPRIHGNLTTISTHRKLKSHSLKIPLTQPDTKESSRKFW